MANLSRMDLSGTRCPRCRSRATVQSAIELRPGVEYLTLRCISCALVYDAQVPSDPTKFMTSVPEDLHRLDQLQLLATETDDPLAERLVRDLIVELEDRLTADARLVKNSPG